jgi:hypothetical protein
MRYLHFMAPYNDEFVEGRMFLNDGIGGIIKNLNFGKREMFISIILQCTNV